MLARVLAVVVCLCFCHTPVLYRNGCTDRADFCVEVSLDLYRSAAIGVADTAYLSVIVRIRSPTACVLGNLGMSKNKGTSPGTLSQILDLENFATAYRRSVSAI